MTGSADASPLALMVFDPDEAARRDAEAAEDRRVEIDLAGAGTAMPGCGMGTVSVYAVLDTADALDLEHAIRGVATQLGELGSTETLAVHRSQALGEIARTQLALDLTPISMVEPGEPLGESESRPRKLPAHCSRAPHQASTRSVAASSLGRGRCSTTDDRVR